MKNNIFELEHISDIVFYFFCVTCSIFLKGPCCSEIKKEFSLLLADHIIFYPVGGNRHATLAIQVIWFMSLKKIYCGVIYINCGHFILKSKGWGSSRWRHLVSKVILLLQSVFDVLLMDESLVKKIFFLLAVDDINNYRTRMKDYLRCYEKC